MKHHNKQIECGLCEYQAKDLDGLNIHLKTCKTYEFTECEYVICIMKKQKDKICDLSSALVAVFPYNREKTKV